MVEPITNRIVKRIGTFDKIQLFNDFQFFFSSISILVTKKDQLSREKGQNSAIYGFFKKFRRRSLDTYILRYFFTGVKTPLKYQMKTFTATL